MCAISLKLPVEINIGHVPSSIFTSKAAIGEYVSRYYNEETLIDACSLLHQNINNLFHFFFFFKKRIKRQNGDRLDEKLCNRIKRIWWKKCPSKVNDREDSVLMKMKILCDCHSYLEWNFLWFSFYLVSFEMQLCGRKHM